MKTILLTSNCNFCNITVDYLSFWLRSTLKQKLAICLINVYANNTRGLIQLTVWIWRNLNLWKPIPSVSHWILFIFCFTSKRHWWSMLDGLRNWLLAKRKSCRDFIWVHCFYRPEWNLLLKKGWINHFLKLLNSELRVPQKKGRFSPDQKHKDHFCCDLRVSSSTNVVVLHFIMPYHCFWVKWWIIFTEFHHI